MNFTLTKDQEQVIEDFVDFLASPDKYFIVQGASGCGKSTIIKRLAKIVEKHHEMYALLLRKDESQAEFELLLTATTNPAAAVLKDITCKPAKTIHSTLQTKVVNNRKTGKTELKLSKNADTIHNALIILDEGSMMDDPLFAMLENRTFDTKVVIIGDWFQLAPVGQSHINMQEMYHSGVQTTVMSQVVRNSGAIQQTGVQFRNTVEAIDTVTRQIMPTLKQNVHPDYILKNLKKHVAYKQMMKTAFQPIPFNGADIIHVDGPTFQRMVDNAFVDPMWGLKTCKVLAWTNARVLQYNQHIRTTKGLPEAFQAGEHVLTNKPIISNDLRASIDQEVEITGIGASFIDEEFYNIPGRMVNLNNKHMAFMPNDQKDIQPVLKSLARQKDWDNYFLIKETYLDLRSPYASTVHKSQGSTYDFVFIDLGDIGRCFNPADVARMLYVAITRARKQVICYGQLPAIYGG